MKKHTICEIDALYLALETRIKGVKTKDENVGEEKGAERTKVRDYVVKGFVTRNG